MRRGISSIHADALRSVLISRTIETIILPILWRLENLSARPTFDGKLGKLGTLVSKHCQFLRVKTRHIPHLIINAKIDHRVWTSKSGPRIKLSFRKSSSGR